MWKLTTGGQEGDQLPTPGLNVDHVQDPLLPPALPHAVAHVPQLEMGILEQSSLHVLLHHVGHTAIGCLGEVLVIQNWGVMPSNRMNF